MTDREALAAEVEADLRACTWRELLASATVLQVAARERLAQLPEKCEHGQTEPHRFISPMPPGHFSITYENCPGKVYPAELVERISHEFASALMPLLGMMKAGDLVALCNAHAVAVLDALNGEPR